MEPVLNTSPAAGASIAVQPMPHMSASSTIYGKPEKAGAWSLPIVRATTWSGYHPTTSATVLFIVSLVSDSVLFG